MVILSISAAGSRKPRLAWSALSWMRLRETYEISFKSNLAFGLTARRSSGAGHRRSPAPNEFDSILVGCCEDREPCAAGAICGGAQQSIRLALEPPSSRCARSESMTRTVGARLPRAKALASSGLSKASDPTNRGRLSHSPAGQIDTTVS